jgi:hypothetical protein
VSYMRMYALEDVDSPRARRRVAVLVPAVARRHRGAASRERERAPRPPHERCGGRVA